MGLVTDEAIVAHLHTILQGMTDLSNVTAKMIRVELEKHFGQSLLSRKGLIMEYTVRYLQEHEEADSSDSETDLGSGEDEVEDAESSLGDSRFETARSMAWTARGSMSVQAPAKQGQRPTFAEIQQNFAQTPAKKDETTKDAQNQPQQVDTTLSSGTDLSSPSQTCTTSLDETTVSMSDSLHFSLVDEQLMEGGDMPEAMKRSQVRSSECGTHLPVPADTTLSTIHPYGAEDEQAASPTAQDPTLDDIHDHSSYDHQVTGIQAARDPEVREGIYLSSPNKLPLPTDMRMSPHPTEKVDSSLGTNASDFKRRRKWEWCLCWKVTGSDSTSANDDAENDNNNNHQEENESDNDKNKESSLTVKAQKLPTKNKRAPHTNEEKNLSIVPAPLEALAATWKTHGLQTKIRSAMTLTERQRQSLQASSSSCKKKKWNDCWFMQVRLRENSLREVAESWRIPLPVVGQRGYAPYRPGMGIFARTEEYCPSLFQPALRQQLTWRVLTEKAQFDPALPFSELLDASLAGCERGEEPRMEPTLIPLSVKDAYQVELQSHFPLHDPENRRWLSEKWALGMKIHQPLERVRSYLGSEIARYFAWLGYYNMWLIMAACIGTIIFFFQVITLGAIDPVAMPVACIFLAGWTTLFQECWKRRNSVLAFQWGVLDCTTTNEPTAPGYIQSNRQPWQRNCRLLLPVGGTSLLLLLSGMSAPVFLLLLSLNPTSTATTTLLAFLLALWVLSSNGAMKKVLAFLYDAEGNRKVPIFRRRSEAKSRFISAVLLLQSLNAYFPLLLLAFIPLQICPASLQERYSSDPALRLWDLRLVVGTLFFTLLIAGNLDEFVVPALQWAVKSFILKLRRSTSSSSRTDADADASKQWESERTLRKLREQEKVPTYSTDSDYAEMVLQYGFVTLFGAVLPILPLFALLNNVIELRADALKVLWRHQRPIVIETVEMQPWLTALDALAYVGVVVNMLILLVSAAAFEIVSSWSNITLFWAIILLEHLLLGAKALLAYMVPDIPAEVEDALVGQQQIRDALLEGRHPSQIPLEDVDSSTNMMGGSADTTLVPIPSSFSFPQPAPMEGNRDASPSPIPSYLRSPQLGSGGSNVMKRRSVSPQD